MICIKRIYDPPSEKDGFRVLVDRLWPRGLRKEAPKIDKWVKTIGPTSDLRKWFNHEPEKWEYFKLRYEDELKENASVADLLELIKMNKTVTLLYAAHDEQHNHAIVLQQFLDKKLKG